MGPGSTGTGITTSGGTSVPTMSSKLNRHGTYRPEPAGPGGRERQSAVVVARHGTYRPEPAGPGGRERQSAVVVARHGTYRSEPADPEPADRGLAVTGLADTGSAGLAGAPRVCTDDRDLETPGSADDDPAFADVDVSGDTGTGAEATLGTITAGPVDVSGDTGTGAEAGPGVMPSLGVSDDRGTGAETPDAGPTCWPGWGATAKSCSLKERSRRRNSLGVTQSSIEPNVATPSAVITNSTAPLMLVPSC